MGIVFHYQGKLDKAIESFNKSILYRPDYAYAFNNLAEV